MHQGVFQGLEVGLLFEAVSLGPPYEKSQKMGDLGVSAVFSVLDATSSYWQVKLDEAS